jgi:hypothetical protein
VLICLFSFFGADFFCCLFFLADFESNRGGYADSSNTASTQSLQLYVTTHLIVDKKVHSLPCAFPFFFFFRMETASPHPEINKGLSE